MKDHEHIQIQSFTLIKKKRQKPVEYNAHSLRKKGTIHQVTTTVATLLMLRL